MPKWASSPEGDESAARSVGFPAAGFEELVERHPAGKVVDRADEPGEGTLGDELKQIGLGEAGVAHPAQDVLANLASPDGDGAGERVDRGVDGFVWLRS